MFAYQKNFVNPTLPVDEAQFWALVRATEWNGNIDKFRETGDAALKRHLPAFIFQSTFDETTSKGGKIGRWRKQAATRLTGLVVMDIDHVEEPLTLYQGWVKKGLDCKKLGIVLIYVTPSGKGLKIVFKADLKKGNLIDNQHAMAEVLGVTVDESCKDASRMSFICKEEDILYLDKELFTYENKEFAARFDNEYREGHSQGTKSLTPKPLIPEQSSPAPALLACKARTRSLSQGEGSGQTLLSKSNGENSQGTEVTTPLSLREGKCPEGAGGEACMWRGYPIQSIIDARYADKLPCAADSNRHNESLKLATDLLLMLDGDKERVQQIVEQQPWVQEIIAERNENVSQTVESAAQCVLQKERKYPDPRPSKAMQEAIERVKSLTPKPNSCVPLVASGRSTSRRVALVPQSGLKKAERSQGEGSGQILLSQGNGENNQGTEVTTPLSLREGKCPEGAGGEAMSQRLWLWGQRISDMFSDFPILQDVCKGLKRNQYPAALFVGGGLMMTLMTRCTYRFYHRPEELRRLNNSTLIIGDPASGKSFATRLYKLLSAPIVEADKIGKEAINAYREQMKTKGANKEKPKKPKVVIRVHPARTSNAQFIQDMVNAIELVDGQEMQLHLLTFDTELDNSLTVQKGGSWIDKQSLQLKAFHNEEDGQAYSNVDSILQDFIVVWNFIYTGTPIAMKKMVNEPNFGTGLATRLTAVPLPSTNFEMMEREPKVDLESDARLSEWAKRLDRTKGELPFGKLVDELYDWTARRMMDAKENESKADEMLLKRCAYHGINFAAPFIVMRHWDALKKDGEFWCGEFETDETDWRLVELIVNMQYACQRYFFGAMAEAYFDNQLKTAAANVQHRQKTNDAFARLPEEFTVEDVVRCFQLNSEASGRSRVRRLQKDGVVEKSGERSVNGTHKAYFRKTSSLIL